MESQATHGERESEKKRTAIMPVILTAVLLSIGVSMGIGIGQQLAPKPTPAPDVNVPANWTVTIRNPQVEITNWPTPPPPDGDGDGVPDAIDQFPTSPFWSLKTTLVQNVVLTPTSPFDVPILPTPFKDIAVTLDAPGTVYFAYTAVGCNETAYVQQADLNYPIYIMPYRVGGICQGLAVELFISEIRVDAATRFLSIEAYA